MPEAQQSAAIEPRENGCFGVPISADSKRAIDVEIGDTKSTDFFPQLKSLFWNNECNFSVRLAGADPAKATVAQKGQVIEWKQDERTARFYQKQSDDENGAFEFEVELASQPASNILEFSLQTKGFSFFYQPPLTAQDVEQGFSRPENVIGSYAVFHSQKMGNRAGAQEYRSGKAFHIYRPFVVDAMGGQTWCELKIDAQAGKLLIIIPQDWLDVAVYPVIVDPTLGYTTIGGSVASNSVSRGKCGLTGAAVENGTATQISVYGRSTSGTCNYCGVIYDNNTLLGTRQDYTAQAGRSGAAAWVTDAVIVGLSLVSGTKYYVGHYHNASAAPGNMETNYDTGGTADGLEYNSGYSSPPPIAATVGSSETNLYSAYITYSAAGGATRPVNFAGTFGGFAGKGGGFAA